MAKEKPRRKPKKLKPKQAASTVLEPVCMIPDCGCSGKAHA